MINKFFLSNNAITVEVPQRIQTLFNKSIEIFAPYAKPEEVNIFFVRKQFRVIFDEKRVGMYIKNLIVFDLDKLENHPEEMVLAVFLEEFAHCYLHIDDEKEVSHAVCKIYPKLEFNGKKYSLK